MRSLYPYDKSKGYELHIKEIRDYAALTASMLGHDVRELSEEERITVLHKLLNEHPYAYPLALEMSLYMPSLVALEWIDNLTTTYYSIGMEDIAREIHAFMIWRKSPKDALYGAIWHTERLGYMLNSVRAYFSENTPRLAAYIEYRQQINENPFCLGSRAWVDGKVQFAARVARKFIQVLSGKKFLPRFMLKFYLKHDCPEAKKDISWLKKTGLWGIRRLLTAGVCIQRTALSRKTWLELPSLEEPAKVPQGLPGDRPCFDIGTVIWGEEYINRFSKSNLQSMLAPGNLPALAGQVQVRCVFYTTHKDMPLIKNLPGFTKLKNYASVKFVFLDNVLEDVALKIIGDAFTDKYIPMIVAHNHLWRTAAAEDRYVIYNFPDIVFQGDMFTRLMKLQKAGKTCIFVYPGPYAIMDKVEEELALLVQDNVLDVPHERLNNLIGKYRHSYAKCFYEGSKIRFFSATLSLHDAGAEGFVANTTCIAPILNKPSKQIMFLDGTLDWYLPLTPFTKFEDIHLFRDNSEVCIASLDPEMGQDNAIRFGSFTLEAFAAGLRKNMRLFNKVLFSQPIRFYHVDKPSDEVWARAEAEAKAYTDQVLQLGEGFLDSIPPLEYFTNND